MSDTADYLIPQKFMSCDNCRHRGACPDKTGLCRSYIHYKVPIFNKIYTYCFGKVEKEKVLGIRYSFPSNDYILTTNKSEYKLSELGKTIFLSKAELKRNYEYK